MKRRDWDREAENWIGWTRELGDDAYGDYAPAFFDAFVPRVERALDVGCGEGRSARDLAMYSEHTFAVDGSFTLTAAAHRAGGKVRYAQADAARLPFRDGSFELVTAYNVLMDLDDLDASLGQFARVLADGGHLAACVLHPTAEAGSFEAREPGARFVIDGSYFDEGSYAATFSRRGREITFSSSRYTLETYVSGLRRSGFAIAALREPTPDPRAVVRDASEERWTRVPLFLFLLAVKLPVTR
jgi:SAM-dependent methyltransferase